MALILKNISYLIFISVLTIKTSYSAESERMGTERVGDTIQILIPALGLASTLFYEDHTTNHYEGTRQWVKALVTFEVITEGLKMMTHKQRPNGQSFKSFPSGHTAAAFMGASFIHKRYGWVYAMPAYAGAAFVGYSRMQAKKHYGEDVLSGAVIGIASSALFTTSYKGVTISPMIANNTVGLNFSTQW